MFSFIGILETGVVGVWALFPSELSLFPCRPPEPHVLHPALHHHHGGPILEVPACCGWGPPMPRSPWQQLWVSQWGSGTGGPGPELPPQAGGPWDPGCLPAALYQTGRGPEGDEAVCHSDQQVSPSSPREWERSARVRVLCNGGCLVHHKLLSGTL